MYSISTKLFFIPGLRVVCSTCIIFLNFVYKYLYRFSLIFLNLDIIIIYIYIIYIMYTHLVQNIFQNIYRYSNPSSSIFLDPDTLTTDHSSKTTVHDQFILFIYDLSLRTTFCKIIDVLEFSHNLTCSFTNVFNCLVYLLGSFGCEQKNTASKRFLNSFFKRLFPCKARQLFKFSLNAS